MPLLFAFRQKQKNNEFKKNAALNFEFYATSDQASPRSACGSRAFRQLTKNGWTEKFIASSNDPAACEIIKKAGIAAGAKVIELAAALPVSEDFGQFSARIPGTMFGLGAGVNCPGLYQPDYDFPEELIEIGNSVFMEIARNLVY